MVSRIAHHALHIPLPFLSLLLILYFWANALAGLDRFPKIHEDEAWQAAPGYTFWAEGHFGTDLFAGFYGMENHYYGFMPLFPLMVGAALHLFGVGLFQARLTPLILTTLVLALTHRLGSKLFSIWHGVLAVAVLVGWRIAGPFAHLVSGIPLADVARITRYDSAVPVFGLGALLLLVSTLDPSPGFSSARTPSSFFLIGILTGLATLSHLYGAFWLPALLLVILWRLGRQAIWPDLLIGAGFGLALTPWLLFVASGWQDFLSQSRNYSDRFGLFDVRFYVINLLNEVERYDPILNGAKESLGAWLWLIIGGMSLVWLVRWALLGQDNILPYKFHISAQILVIVLAVLGGSFTLFLSFKTFTYLATLWPLFAITIAAGFCYVWQAKTRWRWWRPFLALIFSLAMIEGVVTGWRIQTLARQTTPYQVYTQAIAAKLEPNRRLMGLQHYWLGLVEESQSYRSILVPIFWTSPQYVPEPIPFGQAAEAIPPQIILLDQIMLDFLAETANPSHDLHTLGLEIWAYLEQHRARLIGQIDDPTYGQMQIYQLQDTIP